MGINTLSFKEGNYYVCEKETDNTSINSFIYVVFNGRKLKMLDSDCNDLGLFLKNRIYHCLKDNTLTDETGKIISFSKMGEYHFEEVKIDINSDIGDYLRKMAEKNISVFVSPYSKTSDNEILYRITVYECFNNEVMVYGEAIGTNKLNTLFKAYKSAKKELLRKTKLYRYTTNERISHYTTFLRRPDITRRTNNCF